MKLIKLELRRNNLKPYLLGVLGIFIVALISGMFMPIIQKFEPNDEKAQMMATIDMLVPMVSIMFMNCFAILGAIMYSKFVIDEYSGKKNVLLFTYPQKRSSILLAKFSLISVFTFSFMFVLNILASLIIVFVGNTLGLMNEPIDSRVMAYILLFSFLFSIIANLISIIALRVGIWKKSIIWTIVTAVILVSPVGNLVMTIEENLLAVILPLFIVLFGIGTILFMGLLKKVNKMECL